MKSYPIISSALKLAFFQTKQPIQTATIAKEVRVERLEDRVERLEVRVEGVEVRVEGLEVRVEGLEVRVEGLEVRVESFGMLIKSARTKTDRTATHSRIGNTVG